MFHAELMADLECPAHRLIARVAPRGHAKSTCAAFAYPLWCLCEQRKHNIVIVTHEASLSTQFVRDIRVELETNQRLYDEYGDLCRVAKDTDGDGDESRPRRTKRTQWSQTKFTTNTGVTVHAKGCGASLRGTRVGPHRPDLIICDDIEKDELVQSAEQRRKLEEWLRRVVMPALSPDGQLLVLGSIIHYDSLLANLHDTRRFPRWSYRVYRAIEAEPLEDDPDRFRRVALWPGRWPLLKLDEERERVGTLAFEQEYQANPIDDSIRVFRPEWLQRYDEDELVAERLVNLMAVDPATGATAGDYFAVWIGSVDTQTGIIYTRRLILERFGIVDQIRCILAAFEEWRPVKIGIETVAYQAALKDVLAERGRELHLYLPLVGINTIANKRARIEGTAPLYENGTFRLPPVLDPQVEAQFLHFPKARHDDAPDVCAMGIELAGSLRPGGRVEVAHRRGRGGVLREGW